MLSGTFSILITSLKTQRFVGAPLKSGPQHQTHVPQDMQPGADCSLFLSEQDILPVPISRLVATSLHAQGSTLFLPKSPCVHHHHLLNRAHDPLKEKQIKISFDRSFVHAIGISDIYNV